MHHASNSLRYTNKSHSKLRSTIGVYRVGTSCTRPQRADPDKELSLPRSHSVAWAWSYWASLRGSGYAGAYNRITHENETTNIRSLDPLYAALILRTHDSVQGWRYESVIKLSPAGKPEKLTRVPKSKPRQNLSTRNCLLLLPPHGSHSWVCLRVYKCLIPSSQSVSYSTRNWRLSSVTLRTRTTSTTIYNLHGSIPPEEGSSTKQRCGDFKAKFFL